MAERSAFLDRFATGDLSREEERRLAQAAVEDPQLFDALMTASAVRAALGREGSLSDPQPDGRDRQVGRWRSPYGIAALAAAAVVVLFAIVWQIAPTRTAPAPPDALIVRASPGGNHATAPVVTQPLALGGRIEDLAGVSPASFRSVPPPSRAPKAEGDLSMVSDGGEITVALGSLDGVTQGAKLPVFRGANRTNPVAHLTVGAVFRESSRGRVEAARSAVRAGDVAVVTAPLAVAALRQRMVALIGAGDRSGAAAAGRRALPLLNGPGVAVADRWRVLSLVGVLERIGGETTDAIAHLHAAVDLLPAASAPPAQRAEILNELGAALLDGRRPDEAEQVLRDAEEAASGPLKARVENNRGAAAALRGDRAAAERLYRSALRVAAESSAVVTDRRAIEKNLADLTAGK